MTNQINNVKVVRNHCQKPCVDIEYRATHETFHGDHLKPIMGAMLDQGILMFQFSRVFSHQNVSTIVILNNL